MFLYAIYSFVIQCLMLRCHAVRWRTYVRTK